MNNYVTPATNYEYPHIHHVYMLPIIKERKECEVTQLCPTVCNPMDCSLSDSSIHGIFQERVLEWVAISFPRDLPDPGIKPGSPTLHCRQTLYHLNQLWIHLNTLVLVAQTIKNLPAMQETWVWSLCWEELLEKEMVTHSSI